MQNQLMPFLHQGPGKGQSVARAKGPVGRHPAPKRPDLVGRLAKGGACR